MNSFSRNWAVALARTSSSTAPVKSSVAGSAVAKNEASTGIAFCKRLTLSTLNVLESSPAWQRRMISCLTRSADLLSLMVLALYKQLEFQKIPHLWDYFRPSRALPSRQSVEARAKEVTR